MPAARTRTRIARLEREIEAVLRVSRALSQQTSLDDVVEHALRTALDVVGADAGSVLLADPRTRQLNFRHVIGVKADRLRGTDIPWDQGIAGAVFLSGAPQVTGDAKRDRRHLDRIDAQTGYRTRDLITVPLKRWEGKPIGVLQVLNKRRGRLGKDDLTVLTIIAALMAAAVEQGRLYEEAKLAEMGRLVGDIGHDVGNLLTPVICGVGMLQASLREFFEGLPRAEVPRAQPTRELCDEVIRVMGDTSRRIQDRLKQVADCVKRLSAPPEFASCELARVVESVLETLRFPARERGVALRAVGLDALPPLLADERQLYTAFYNLVNNAIPEVPAGGTVTVGGRLAPGGDAVALTLTDTGRGMPAAVRDSLFTDRAISRKVGGTGLGTRIVKNVVEAHGGEIGVESEEGAGTTFRIRLPLRPPAALTARRESRSRPRP